MKILIIGGGNMGMTYAQNFLRAHIVQKDDLMILQRNEASVISLMDLGYEQVYHEPDKCVPRADLIILAVKPQDCLDLFKSLSVYDLSQTLLFTIMAGVTIADIKTHLGCSKVIRAMPNLPAQVGAGMTVFTSTLETSRKELIHVQNMINATGKSIYVEDEDMLNAATAISGSGPAYVFYLLKYMKEAATDMGFHESEAELMALETFQGALDVFVKSPHSFDQWIHKVSSKGGTTVKALASFEENEVGKGFKQGMQAALSRARDLSSMI